VFGKLDFRAVRSALGPGGVFVSTVPSWGIGVATLRTLVGSSRAKRARLVVVRSRRADLELVRAWVESGTLRPVVDRVLKLDEGAEAQRYLETRRARGKVVLRVAGGDGWALYGGLERAFLEARGGRRRTDKKRRAPCGKVEQPLNSVAK
jgi:Zinc-binding dehydrogenase